MRAGDVRCQRDAFSLSLACRQPAHLAQRLDCLVERGDAVLEERENTELGARGERRHAAHPVGRRVQLGQRAARGERLERHDAVEVDVEHEQAGEAGAAVNGAQQ
eukprot:5844144-Prymnesium_polylepis.1